MTEPMVLTRRAPAQSGRPLSADAETMTVEAIGLTPNGVQRFGRRPDASFGPWEEVPDLAVADLSRAVGGPVLRDHFASTDSQIGVIEGVSRTSSAIVFRLRFSPQHRELFDEIVQGIRRQVSCGYDITAARREGGTDANPRFVCTVTLLEVSLVAIAADPAAQFRSFQPGVSGMTTPTAVDDGVTAGAVAAERDRAAGILDLAHRGRHGDAFARQHIEAGTSLEAVRTASLELLHQRTETDPINGRIRVEGGYDATEPTARREAMSLAVAHRMAPGLNKLEPGSRALGYRGWSLADLAAEHCGIRSRNKGEILTRSLHTTSDFPLILESALNKNLLSVYDQAAPSYRTWTVQRTFNDLRAHGFYRPGDFPDLTVNPEVVEVTLGTMGESKESVAALKYARRIALSFEMLVNDDLGAFSDLGVAASRRSAEKENSLVYAQLALNSGSGPTLRDNAAMCTTTRTNKASSGTAIDVTNVGAARAAMRRYTSIDGLKLNINPQFLMVGPDKEVQALQFLVSTTTPATDANANHFKSTMQPVVDANISGNNWYLAAPAQAPSMIWGYLAGYDGPRFEVEPGWSTVGVEYRLLLVFGCGGIDWRGMYHNPGA